MANSQARRDGRDKSRRDFLRRSAAACALVAAPSVRSARQRLRVAALCTSFRYREHAHVILENFLAPYFFNGEIIDPTQEFEIASMYIEQTPDDDMGRGVAREFGIPLYDSIDKALSRGRDVLNVDAVLSIGEHGTYPVNEKAQVEYPRKRFFDEIVRVFERSGRVAPVFNDKHLSYRADWARAMVDTARRLNIPFMAGSSVPLAERRPPLEIELGAPIETAVSIHGGPLESYDFHGLEILQSILELRPGGAGVRSVQFLEGDALWHAADQGVWPADLADAAMRAELGQAAPSLKELLAHDEMKREPVHGILINYDDLNAIMLRVGSRGIRWNLACKLKNSPIPLATSFHVGPWRNRCLFKALSHAIQQFFRERKAPYPVERTLLTTCVLDAAMDSRKQGGVPVAPDTLSDLGYTGSEMKGVRELGETWRLLPADPPEPRGIDPTGREALRR